MTAEWTGPECFMCNGTGRDRTAVTEPHGMFAHVVGHVENGLPCRACNGHGRDPKCVGCPFRRDCPSCPWSGGIPAAATESDAVSAGQRAKLAVASQTCETPASAGTDRGRGHDEIPEGDAS